MHKCFKAIPDLLEHVSKGQIILVPLHENSKQPLYKEWNTRDYALNDIVEYQGTAEAYDAASEHDG